MNPVAAANQIAQDRTVATVTYALTGDAELDFMSGVLALEDQTQLTGTARRRVLLYLVDRLERTVKTEAEWEQLKTQLGQTSASSGQIATVPSSFGTQYAPVHVGPPPDPGFLAQWEPANLGPPEPQPAPKKLRDSGKPHVGSRPACPPATEP